MFNHITDDRNPLVATSRCDRSTVRRGITFVPEPRMILMCRFIHLPDADMGPKIRPVIVISPSEQNLRSALIVPISHAAHMATGFDVRLTAVPLPWQSVGKDNWAFISKHTRVPHRHLDRVRISGRFDTPYLTQDDFERVLEGIAWQYASIA